jgi:hypothetical protein
VAARKRIGVEVASRLAMSYFRHISLLALMGCLALGASSAEASVITIADCYTGCAGLTGFVRVTVTEDDGINQNNPATGDLKVVIENLTNGFIDEIGLFYFPTGLPGTSVIQSFTPSGSTGAPTLTSGQCATDNSGQPLNVCIDFPQPNATRFDAGESVTFFIDSTVALNENFFFFTGGFAHIQEIGGGTGSAKTTDTTPGTPDPRSVVSEPATLALFGSALTAAARRRRKSHRA